MTRQLKVYGYRERTNCFLPRDVLTALGAPRHVQQGQLMIWATTTKAAFERCADLGLSVRNPRDLGTLCGTDVTTLAALREWPDGTVLASLGYQGTIVEICDNPDRTVLESPYSLTVIGKLEFARTVFTPRSDFEPEITDAMLNAAINATAGSYTHLLQGAETLRAAIRAALKAQQEARS